MVMVSLFAVGWTSPWTIMKLLTPVFMILVTGIFIKLSKEELYFSTDNTEYEYFDENGQETPAKGWKKD